MSQMYQKERREKYTTAATSIGGGLMFVVFAAGEIGKLPVADRGGAWIGFLATAAVVGIPTGIALWRLTPWPEVSETEKKITLSGAFTLAAGGSILSYVVQQHPSGTRLGMAVVAGFFVSVGVVFFLVGLFRRWISKDEAFRD